MQISLQEAIEHRAKLAYQDFYNANKHAFCLGSWEQLTEGQKEHYRKVSNKAMWEELDNIVENIRPVFTSYNPSEDIKLESIEEYEKANPNLLPY